MSNRRLWLALLRGLKMIVSLLEKELKEYPPEQ